MKSKVTLLIAVILIISLMIGCAKKPVVKAPTVASVTAPLAEIIVFKGSDVPISVSRHDETYCEHVNFGGSITLTAYGIDANGKRVRISPTWTADDPEVFQITPSQGPTVTIKSIAKRPIYNTTIIIEADGVKRKFPMSTH